MIPNLGLQPIQLDLCHEVFQSVPTTSKSFRDAPYALDSPVPQFELKLGRCQRWLRQTSLIEATQQCPPDCNSKLASQILFFYSCHARLFVSSATSSFLLHLFIRLHRRMSILYFATLAN